MFDMETWPHTTAVMTEITVGPAVRQIPQPQSPEVLVDAVALGLITSMENYTTY